MRDERTSRSDVRLLVCLLSTASLLSSSAVVLIVLYLLYGESEEAVRPALVAGVVLIGAGVIVMICALEVACRYLKDIYCPH